MKSIMTLLTLISITITIVAAMFGAENISANAVTIKELASACSSSDELYVSIETCGKSMEPTLHDGSFYAAIEYDGSYPIQRGDIVTCPIDILSERLGKDMTGLGGELFIKRVIGVGGDVLTFDNETSTLYINGVKYKESYLNEQNYTWDMGDDESYTVPDGCLFLMGDNRNHSTDSRKIGCIGVDDVVYIVVTTKQN